jgi:hypothetical protein
MIAPAAIVTAMTAMPAPARDLRVNNTSHQLQQHQSCRDLLVSPAVVQP